MGVVFYYYSMDWGRIVDFGEVFGEEIVGKLCCANRRINMSPNVGKIC